MLDASTIVSIAPDPMLDPTQASITLCWRIVKKESDISFVEIQTEPQSDSSEWKIDDLFEKTGATKIPGNYCAHLSSQNGLDLQVPKAMKTCDSSKLSHAVSNMLKKHLAALYEQLSRCPSDEEIKTAAVELLRIGLDHFMHQMLESNDQTPRFHDVSRMMMPGFVKIAGAACSTCRQVSGRGTYTISLGDALEAINAQNKKRKIGTHGRRYVVFENGQMQVKMGFMTHDSPFALAINERFAARLALILASIEVETVKRAIQIRHRVLTAQFHRIRQIAHNFGVTLTDNDAEKDIEYYDVKDETDPAFADAAS